MGASDCGDYRIGLGVYALGRLAGTEAAELRAHVDRCGPCQAELDELCAVAGLLERSRTSLWTRRGAGGRARTRPSGAPFWLVNGACAGSAKPPTR